MRETPARQLWSRAPSCRCFPALGRSMRPFWATPYYPTEIHPALNNFAEECCAVLARLLAYLGTLASLILVGIHLWGQLPSGEASEQAAKPGWSQALRSHPASPSARSISTIIRGLRDIRHPEGGRKDVLRWAVRDGKPSEKPVAELEIYRPGGKFNPSEAAFAQIATRIEPSGGRELETAGVIGEQIRQCDAVAARGLCGRRADLPWLRQTHRRAKLADLRLVLPGRDDTRPARRDWLYFEPAGAADGRKRPEIGRIIRPRRTQAGELRGLSDFRRLADLGGQSEATRHALTRPRRLVFVQHSGSKDIIVKPCGPIDLVTSYSRQLKWPSKTDMATCQPKRT